ncbi:MAG: OmpA family protein [Alphaproteobacteria bacterium]|nr:OmpA family protein [Alphaproteobacteria bacterium]
MVFLFIAVIYAQDANQRTENVSEIVNEWRDSEQDIWEALWREFEGDLERWNAEIDRDTLTVRFVAPEVLFEAGSSELALRFEEILDDFIPRYVALLNDRFSEQVREVRIEGHTSSEWGDSTDLTEAFLNNMELSQQRTREVLSYALSIPAVSEFRSWIRSTVSANGLSSARLIIANGTEDKVRSRRVEFTIRTKTKEALFRILDNVAPVLEDRSNETIR